MFGFLRRDKSNGDPLSNLQTVSKWMHDMPVGDTYAAMATVIESLIRFNQANMPVSRDRLQVLMHLDEQASDIHATLCAQYLRSPRMSKPMEMRMFQTIYAFYWETTRGYHTFLRDFVNNPGGSKIQQFIPVVTARAIKGFADLFKWRYIRQERVDDHLWLKLHNLYRMSAFEDFHTKKITLYKSDQGQTSCSQKYLQSLMLSAVADGGGHSPRQIEMVDGWLNAWSTHISISELYDQDVHHFYVDTSQGRGMQAIKSVDDLQMTQTMCYLDTTQLLEHMHQVELDLRGGATPAALGLGEDFRLPEGYDTITNTAARWSLSCMREKRRSERIPCESNLDAICNLESIHSMFMAGTASQMMGELERRTLTPEELLDIKLYGFVTERTKAAHLRLSQTAVMPQSETWQLFDQSTHGIGAMAQEIKPFKAGMLVAIRVNRQEEWQLGVVRRISRRRDSVSVFVGLELKHSDITATQLSDADELHGIALSDVNVAVPNTRANIKALHLFDHARNQRYIIMPSAHYSNGRRYKSHTNGSDQLVQLEGVVSKGDGWVEAAYSYSDGNHLAESWQMPVGMEIKIEEGS